MDKCTGVCILGWFTNLAKSNLVIFVNGKNKKQTLRKIKIKSQVSVTLPTFIILQ